jgi:4-amino-4-deoxy-L-arabinose transferase-like glycosyltransferase
VVLAVALVLAGILYIRFLAVHRSLWDNPTHDRNAHYLLALKLATELHNGQVVEFLENVNDSRVWPPLHALLTMTVLLIGGLDYRLAVLPSLAAWVVTALVGFLVARRTAGRGGTVAGLVAALFILASPGHRAFATDVMLESLGAALTLLAVYCYLLAVQGRADEVWKGRCLGLALSALFLGKYNYWLLVVLALCAAEFTARPRLILRTVWDTLTAVKGRHGGRPLQRWPCHPLTFALAAALVLTGVVYCRGDRPFRWGEREVSLYPPHNLIHVAYVLLFLRLLPWWLRTGRNWARRLDGRLRQVLLWHVGFVALWLLLPKHPSYFLYYLSLANADPEQRFSLSEGARNYATWFVDDYHLGPKTALLIVGLAAAALVSWRRLRPGGRAVLFLAVLAAALSIAHPNRKGRNLHSWVAAVWVLAGVGAAQGLIGRPRLRACLGGTAVAGLVWAQAPALWGNGHALEGGPHPDRPCLLDVTDAYLADLDNSRRGLILSAVPLKPMAQWTFLERHGSFAGLEERWYGFGSAGEVNRRGFAHWLQTTDCDTLVYCDATAPIRRPEAGPECDLHAELKDILHAQQVFRLVKQTDVTHYACRVEVWRRAPRSGRCGTTRQARSASEGFLFSLAGASGLSVEFCPRAGNRKRLGAVPLTGGRARPASARRRGRPCSRCRPPSPPGDNSCPQRRRRRRRPRRWSTSAAASSTRRNRPCRVRAGRRGTSCSVCGRWPKKPRWRPAFRSAGPPCF